MTLDAMSAGSTPSAYLIGVPSSWLCDGMDVSYGLVSENKYRRYLDVWCSTISLMLSTVRKRLCSEYLHRGGSSASEFAGGRRPLKYLPRQKQHGMITFDFPDMFTRK